MCVRCAVYVVCDVLDVIRDTVHGRPRAAWQAATWALVRRVRLAEAERERGRVTQAEVSRLLGAPPLLVPRWVARRVLVPAGTA